MAVAIAGFVRDGFSRAVAVAIVGAIIDPKQVEMSRSRLVFVSADCEPLCRRGESHETHFAAW
jgi:hypothetical protein